MGSCPACLKKGEKRENGADKIKRLGRFTFAPVG
jgi:hypothetical protein